jgi:hypothetical protein
MKLEFYQQSFGGKKKPRSSFIKIRPVVAELLHADGQIDGQTDGQADTTRLGVAFRNFAKAAYFFNVRKLSILSTPCTMFILSLYISGLMMARD